MSKCQRDVIAAKVDNQMTSLMYLGVRDRGLNAQYHRNKNHRKGIGAKR